MSARRVLAGSVAALLLPASLLLTTETGSATDSAARAASTSVTKKAGQKISLEVLPQIVQQGKRTASANSAKAAVTATIKPVKVGRKVVLEQLQRLVVEEGRHRQAGEVAAGPTSPRRSPRAASALTYRVTAQKYKGAQEASPARAPTPRAG